MPSSEERALLDCLLAAESVPAEVRAQAEHVRVTGSCECGCGTIYLGVDRAKGTAGPNPELWLVEADILGSPPEQVVLFVKQGLIEALEVLWYENPRPLPRADEITAARVSLGAPLG